MQEVARKFAAEVMIPAATAHDRSGAYPQAIFKQAWETGLVSDISRRICADSAGSALVIARHAAAIELQISIPTLLYHLASLCSATFMCRSHAEVRACMP